MNLIEHYIDGKVVSGSSDRKGKVYNPATGNQESEVRLGSKSDLNTAVEKAKKHLRNGQINLHFKEQELYLSLKRL